MSHCCIECKSSVPISDLILEKSEQVMPNSYPTWKEWKENAAMDQGRGKRKNVIKMISVSSTSGSSSNPEAVIGAESMGMRVIQKKSG